MKLIKPIQPTQPDYIIIDGSEWSNYSLFENSRDTVKFAVAVINQKIEDIIPTTNTVIAESLD